MLDSFVFCAADYTKLLIILSSGKQNPRQQAGMDMDRSV